MEHLQSISREIFCDFRYFSRSFFLILKRNLVASPASAIRVQHRSALGVTTLSRNDILDFSEAAQVFLFFVDHFCFSFLMLVARHSFTWPQSWSPAGVAEL